MTLVLQINELHHRRLPPRRQDRRNPVTRPTPNGVALTRLNADIAIPDQRRV